MSGIETRVVEGVHADEALVIVATGSTSFVIVKGVNGNIAVELDEDGWHRLAIAAMEQGIRAEVPVAFAGSASLVAAWLEKAMAYRGFDIRDLAMMLHVDTVFLQRVFREDAHLPDSFLPRVADILELPRMGLERAASMDRERFPDRPDSVVAYGGSRIDRRGVNRPKRMERKERGRKS